MKTLLHLSQASFLFTLVMTLLLLFSDPALAQGPVELDPSFDGDGLVTTNFLDGNTGQAYALVLQPDGKIIVAGYAYNSIENHFTLTRYNPDGSLDISFGSDGKVMTIIGGRSDYANALALQPDGKIIAAGYVTGGPTGNDFALVRYNTDGTLDPTFGNSGKVTTTFGSSTIDNNVIEALALQPNGKIIAAGYSYNGSNFDFALARYNPDGTLDPSFSGDGKLTTLIRSNNDVARTLILQPDGKIVVAGHSHNGSNDDFALVRYNANGTLDSSFDGDGRLTSPIGSSNDLVYALALQPDGKLVAAGYSHNGNNYDFALVRYNVNGALDTNFDGDGKLTTPIGSSNDLAYALTLQPDGKLLAAGRSNNDFAVVRYNSDGSLDLNFDGDGKLSTLISSDKDEAQALTLQPDGKIVVAGYAWVSSTRDDFALTRYNPDGSLDLTFDSDGKLTTPIGKSRDVALALVLQPDNKVVVGGYSLSNDGYTISLARYNIDGSLDLTFDNDGKLLTQFDDTSDDAATAIALQPDGKILVAGFSSHDGNDDFALVRYNPNGTLDSSFSDDGKVTTNFNRAYALILQPDGKILVAGNSVVGGGYGFALARYNPDGSLDLSFDGDGKVTTRFNETTSDGRVTALALQPDGKIIAAGYSSISVGMPDDYALARYNVDGSLDLTFDGDGKLVTSLSSNDDYAYAMALQPDGKIVVAGVSNKDMALLRYNTDGTLDATFNGDGKVITDFGGNDYASALVLQLDSKIIVVGDSEDGFTLVRYNSDGSLDLNFDGDGKVTNYFGDYGGNAHTVALQLDNKIVASAGINMEGSEDFGVARYLNPVPDLRLIKTASPLTLQPGQAITYTLAFSNAGAVTVSGVVLTDIIPVGQVGNLSYHTSGVTLTETGTSPTYAWAVQDLEPGEGGIITITGQISPSLIQVGRFTNTAEIISLTGDLDPRNNRSSVGVDISLPILTFNSATYNAAEEGPSAVITLSLSSAPEVDITVEVNSGDGTASNSSDYTPIDQTITFPAGQTVTTFTVSLTDDILYEGDETLNLALQNPVATQLGSPDSAILTLLENDTPPQVSIADTSVTEGDSGSPSAAFTITLSAASGLDTSVGYTTIPGSATASSDYTPRSGVLTLSAGITTATIDVPVKADQIDEEDESFIVELNNPVNGSLGDGQGTGTIVDDDSAGVLVNTTALTVSEPGSTGSFVIQLTSEPTATVTLPLLSTDPSECSVSPSINLTNLTWETGVTTTVSAVDDAMADGVQSCVIQTTASSADPNYNAKPVDDVTVTILDNDGPGITVSSPTTLTTTETGRITSFNIVLNSLPTAPVTLALSSSDPSEGKINLTTLVFNQATWNISRTVIITGQNDLVDDGDIDYTITFTPVVSADPNYNGLTPAPLSLTNLDDDTAGLLLPTILTATEETTITYQIRLTSQPTTPVTVTLTTDGQTQASPAVLVFALANWNQPKMVSVAALEDGVKEDSHSGTISHTVSSLDPPYADLESVTLTVELEERVTSPDNFIFLPILISNGN